MLFWKTIKIRPSERGLLFREGSFERVLAPGTYREWDPLFKLRVDVVSVKDGWLVSEALDEVVRSGQLDGEAEILDLTDRQRALVWFDERFERVLGPGLYAAWNVFRRVRVEVIDVEDVRLVRDDLPSILAGAGAAEWLNVTRIDVGAVGLLFREGDFLGTLPAGTQAVWAGVGKIQIRVVDTRESALDVTGQEIMTADKVTLRLNAVATWRVVDPLASVTKVADAGDALYRETQLALRALIGTRELDQLLASKDALADDVLGQVRARVAGFGLEVVSLGIKDVILPGEMKALLNRVTEAKAAAEAALVTRREETAAMRSQSNTARLLDGNPTLMRLRELEVLEKVADKATLNVVLGEQGLIEGVTKLL